MNENYYIQGYCMACGEHFDLDKAITEEITGCGKRQFILVTCPDCKEKELLKEIAI